MRFRLFNNPIVLGAFDFVGIIILAVLIVIHLSNFKHDADAYAKLDPAKPY